MIVFFILKELYYNPTTKDDVSSGDLKIVQGIKTLEVENM